MTSSSPSLRAGVIGWPIAHSKSPRLHGYWLEKHGISGSYDALAATVENFEATIRNLVEEGWKGANVTLPHKEAALALADEATTTAKAIGAANTLVFEAGRIHADNTDAFGFIENLRHFTRSDWKPGPNALILGAGGASRAVIHALAEAGVTEIRVANRTKSRTIELAETMAAPITLIDWEDRDAALEGADLIVNTTSLGMKGQPTLSLDLTRASENALATDIVYTPLITPFLQAASDRGLNTVDGLGMLLHQARPGFEAWFGLMPKVDDALRERMLAP